MGNFAENLSLGNRFRPPCLFLPITQPNRANNQVLKNIVSLLRLGLLNFGIYTKANLREI